MPHRLGLAVLLAAATAGCTKQPAIGSHTLKVPAGCEASADVTNGDVNCEDGSQLSWLASPSEGVGSLDHGESVIREALGGGKDVRIVREELACTVAGSEAQCRRVTVYHLGTKMVGLLGFATVGGKPFYVECDYQDRGEASHPVCDGVFTLR